MFVFGQILVFNFEILLWELGEMEVQLLVVNLDIEEFDLYYELKFYQMLKINFWYFFGFVMKCIVCLNLFVIKV